MLGVRQDLGFGLRTLARRPGYAAVAVATLALGIGATTAVFSAVNAVLLRPLPFPEPEALVRVEERHRTGPRLNLTGATVATLAERGGPFAALASYRLYPFNLAGDGPAEPVTAARVAPGFFNVLGAGPASGRLFAREDFHAGADRVVVLREGLWRRRFGSDPGALGRAIRLDGESYRVVGVFPDRLAFPRDADVWLPLYAEQAVPHNSVSHLFTTLGRLKPGLALPRAQAELASLAAGIVHVEPFSLAATPLRERLTESVGPALWALFGAVALLLLVACANVATLLLARGEQRTREMAIRAAVGASRGRLARQMLAESLLLGLLAALPGVAVALAATRLFGRLAPPDLPRLDELRVESAALAFALLLCLATALLFGLWPALQAGRADLRARAAAGGGRLTRALVVGEVALLVLLLSGAGLLARTFLTLTRVPLGFDSAGVLTFYVSPGGEAYRDAAAIAVYVDAVLERLRGLPGARQVAAANGIPTRALPGTSFALEGVAAREGEADVLGVSPDYFRLLRIPTLAGRTFGDGDALGAPVVAVLSRAAAQAFWPGASPLGRRLTMLHWDVPLTAEVVGVVEDIRQRGPDQDIQPAVYFSHRQFADRVLGWYFQIRTDGPSERLVPALRQALASVDPDQPADAIRTLDDVLASAAAGRRFNASLFGALALLALALVLVGLQGVLGRHVAERRREIGIRMALGAHPRRISKAVVADAVKLAGTGLALGLPASWLTGRTLASLLYRVTPADPPTTAGVVGAIVAVAVLGAWLPARRAARVDPLVSLRQD